MRRRIKNGSRLYYFLEEQGVLESGNKELIENTKKKYWKECRKNYKRIKRQESKSFVIFFNFKEFKIINQEAKKSHTSPTNFIRQSALNNNRGVVDRVEIGKLRKELFSN